MPRDPRTPVIVAVGQVTVRPDEGATYAQRPTPLTLMTAALTRCVVDAGVGESLLGALEEIVAIGSFTWHPVDPARLVADALGLGARRTRLTPVGGNLPQKLVHEYARRIGRGELGAVAVVGAEAMYAEHLARREGRDVNWPDQDPRVVAAPELVEKDRDPLHPDERRAGLRVPADVYPLFENARRHRRHWDLEIQRRHLGRLWSNFATVAANNPYAWLRSSPSAETITTPTPSNRMVATPYTKLLVANLPVDMGAAFVMTSLEVAERLGVARDALIFPVAGAEGNDHWFVSERPDLDDSPAMRACWRALRACGERVEDLAAIDLYSCFPTVVQSACDVLGIDAFDTARVPTLTGGLTFGGGPGNNYVTHAIAATVDRLRARPDERALVTGLGWFATKHAWGTYQASPPSSPFQWRHVQREVDQLPRLVVARRDGAATIESYTVVHDRHGPRRLIVLARHDGLRVWGYSEDATLLTRALEEDLVGVRGEVRDGVVTL